MKIKIILATLFVLLSFTLAQTTDMELWSGGLFQLKLSGKSQIHLEEQLRFNQNVSKHK